MQNKYFFCYIIYKMLCHSWKGEWQAQLGSEESEEMLEVLWNIEGGMICPWKSEPPGTQTAVPLKAS